MLTSLHTYVCCYDAYVAMIRMLLWYLCWYDTHVAMIRVLLWYLCWYDMCVAMILMLLWYDRYVLDNVAMSSVERENNRQNPKVGTVIPPYNSQHDPHPRAYFRFQGVNRVSTIPSTHTHTHGPTSASRVSPGWVPSPPPTPTPTGPTSGSRVSPGWVPSLHPHPHPRPQPYFRRQGVTRVSTILFTSPTPTGLLQIPGCHQGEYHPSTHGPTSGSRVSPGWVPSLHPRAYFRFQGVTRVSTIPPPTPSPTPTGLLQVPGCQQGEYQLLHPHPHPRAYFRFQGVTRVSTISSIHTHTHGPTSGSRVSPGWVPSPPSTPTPTGLLQVPGCHQGEYHLLHPHPHQLKFGF